MPRPTAPRLRLKIWMRAPSAARRGRRARCAMVDENAFLSHYFLSPCGHLPDPEVPFSGLRRPRCSHLSQRWWRRARADDGGSVSELQAIAPGGDSATTERQSGVYYFPLRSPGRSLRNNLRESTTMELSLARKMASLSAFAYFIPSVTARRPRRPAAARPRHGTRRLRAAAPAPRSAPSTRATACGWWSPAWR